MATARRFPMLRYNPDGPAASGRALAPPYDVIDDDDAQRFIADEPHSSVLLDRPPDGPDGARATLDAWLEQDVLEEGVEGVAFVQQRYIGPDGVRRTRVGILCEVELEQFDGGSINAHEKTFAKPRKGRVDLMMKTGINTSPVFLLYHDPSALVTDIAASVTDDEPDFTGIERDGTQTAVWFVEDLALLERVEAIMSGQNMLIADGHHRYNAALDVQQQLSESPSLQVVGGTDHTGPTHTSSSGGNGLLAFVANSADRGILVFPTHRVMSGLDTQLIDDFTAGSGAFDVTEHDDVETAFMKLETIAAPGFVVYTKGRARVFATNDPADLEIASPGTSDTYRSFDVVALHELLIDGGAVLGDHASNTVFTRSIEDAVQAVDSGEGDVAFLIRNAEVGDVHEVASKGEIMPQKSTYFYPKVPTGIAFRRIHDGQA